MSSPPPYPGQPGDPQDPDQPGRQAPPSGQSAPDQPGHGQQPGYEQQPYGQQPGYSPQPGYGQHPGYAPQPGYGQQPGQAQQPGYEQPYGQQQPYGQPAYGSYPQRPDQFPGGGQPGPGGPVGAPPRNGVGIAALVFGILGLLTFWILVGGLFGLVAIALGIIGIARVRKRIATNQGVAISGLVLGVLGVLATVAFAVFAVGVFTSIGGTDFYECVEQAGGDPAAVQQCQQQWEERLQQESDRLDGT
ncbi:DUF4190 domain-containing protein [Pseudonocardia sp. NPDC049635]|uniref:DUF4190 domain-containing protein n=1 Tax=Pseudonocardia sp. NPDC049635 TaxID=3155506 RepID=UPI0033EA684F